MKSGIIKFLSFLMGVIALAVPIYFGITHTPKSSDLLVSEKETPPPVGSILAWSPAKVNITISTPKVDSNHFVVVNTGVTFTDPLIGKNKEYKDGFNAGMKYAAYSSMQNRDHWRRMLEKQGIPFHTHKETIDEIYSHNWYGPFAPRRLDYVRGEEPKEGPGIVDSVDLYVVLPDDEKMEFK